MTEKAPSPNPVLTGIWLSPEGKLHSTLRVPGGKTETREDDFCGFGWVESDLIPEGTQSSNVSSLEGDGPLDTILSTDEFALFGLWASRDGLGQNWECIRPYESQHLLKHRWRLFEGLRFDQLKRCQLDIETDCSVEGRFSNPYKDKVLAIGLKMGEREKLLYLESEDGDGEKQLLDAFVETLIEWDPDVIEGHNIFSFDLNYLKIRSGKRGVECRWGRYGQEAKFRKSRLKVAERWVDFVRCDIPGRSVFDTYLMAQLYDVTSRDMPGYGLKVVAKYFGVTAELDHERTYIEGDQIAAQFRQDRETFLEYLRDDLLETEGIAAILLPTYFEQCKSFPVLLQEACLRGSSSKVDLLFYERYFHAKHALPYPAESFAEFAGGYTKSFREGVFKKVLHYDVASLYPSLLLKLERNPAPDDLGVFLPMLKELREYRLRFKQLARTEKDPALRSEYQARQSSYKILINSFYGYLGFPGARFGDAELAAEVTAQGRELLQKIIDTMESLEADPLEADTDGIYITSEKWFENPDELLSKVQAELPDGIELELGGSYESMLCYKAKNYALNDGTRVLIKGSALKSRGIEPYLSHLTRVLIHSLLEATDEKIEQALASMRESITSGSADVSQLAKSETLNQSPTKYQKAVEEGGKPRRAALEVALRKKPMPGLGSKVTYFVGPGEKGKRAMWQRAFDVEEFDPETCPYDAKTYLKKLDEWEKKYKDLIGLSSSVS
jgi:DNA polymerase I